MKRSARKMKKSLSMSMDSSWPSKGEWRKYSKEDLWDQLQLQVLDLQMRNRELKQVQKELTTTYGRYEDLYDTCPVSYITLDDQGRIEDANLTAAVLLGVERARLIGKPFDRYVPEHRQQLQEYLRKCRAYWLSETTTTTTTTTTETTLTTPDGRNLEVQLHTVPVKDGARKTPSLRMAILDISERKIAEKTIVHQAYHDSLTGLPNRALFLDRLKMEIARAAGHGGQLGVLFLDLDDFKNVNDSLGHSAGDQVIREAAGRLSAALRQGDTVCRVGGDEFIILLPALPVPGDPEGLSERILEKFREPFHVGGQEIHIHISIGISRFPDDGKDGDTLVKHADVALYHAKEKGKNSHEFFKPAMNNRAVERIAMENGLRRALKGGEFALYYQPEVDCEGRICGLESLLRWNSPDQGLVFPARIIHLAEKTGLMAPLGDWILREACRQAEQWCRQGLTVPLVSVNLSATQFHNGKLVESIGRILEEERITPDFLELEITESTAMRDLNHSLTVMRKLKKMGVRLALDDFGTGHSSLGYLKKFPIDTLKIDQLFIRELLTNGQDRAIVLAILLLARSLNMRVVAEGVESRDQFLWLQKAGCDGLQGYLFGEAAPADRVTETLRMEAKASLAPPPRPAESKSAKLKT